MQLSISLTIIATIGARAFHTVTVSAIPYNSPEPHHHLTPSNNPSYSLASQNICTGSCLSLNWGQDQVNLIKRVDTHSQVQNAAYENMLKEGEDAYTYISKKFQNKTDDQFIAFWNQVVNSLKLGGCSISKKSAEAQMVRLMRWSLYITNHPFRQKLDNAGAQLAWPSADLLYNVKFI
ncbi:hypothetical protein BC835DRAFT_1520491 [Cytidiella melzeri]|nr:hypothetical protein BC835DRAFT_1520491 [Cytidiella melzeri]